MENKINPNAVNQFLKDTDIYIEGESVFSIAMIIKGRVLIHNSGAKVVLGSGAFIGINDLYSGSYQSTYTACDDLVIYAFPITKTEELDAILSFNKDYHGLIVASFYKIIFELDQIYQGIIKQGNELHKFLTDTYHSCMEAAVKNNYKVKQSDRIKALRMLTDDLVMLNDKVAFYSECKNLPMEAVKLFYSYGNAVTMYQVEEQIDLVNLQIEALKNLSEAFISMAKCLVDDTDSSLYGIIMELSAETNNISGMELLDIMDSIIEKINMAEIFTEKMLDQKFNVDRKKMEESYHRLLTGEKGKKEDSEKESKHSKTDAQVLDELHDSFQKILNYAEVEEDRAQEMKAVMSDFVKVRDKSSADDSVRAMRRKITENHYIIYKSVFLRAYREKNPPRLMDLFLKYGFADERLLTDEQLISLYFLEEPEIEQNACNVYDIKTWLTLIYEGKKEPSKNEFDLEYPEMLAGLKRQAKLTDKELVVWLTDRNKKLEYEIENMFRYNNRTTNGQITSFVPVLNKDQLPGNVERAFLSISRVNEAVSEIMKVDYSIFDREVLYANKEKNIVKEYIIKRAMPDIIRMPNAGSNGVMWQEISGKKRDTSGRFLLPIFTDVDVNLLLVRIFGRFRWELCRTIEGASWNDITNKSLTSEYTDYLQFYRKNKELSEEKKEKVKSQIQKGRNSSREIFVIDYEQWINYEALGAIKLNKPVREIMATYCPFSKELREKLRLQPIFEDAMARYFRDKLKKTREVEGRYRLLQKDKIELTSELVDTLNYYKNL